MTTIRTALIVDPRNEIPEMAAAELQRLNIKTAAPVGYGLNALQTAYHLKPDLILMRVSAPAARPLAMIQGMHDAMPDSPILAFVDNLHTRLQSSLTIAGASACTDQSLSPALLAAMIGSAGKYFERHHRTTPLVTSGGGEIITILGSKGGVGKTTLATNLAVALAQQTQAAVALVDADPHFGDVALSLDIDLHKTLQILVEGLGSLETHNIREYMTNKYGIWIVPAHARPGQGGQVNGEQLSEVLDHLRDAFEFVIIDTGGAFTELSSIAATRASTKVLITTPERNSVHDAAARVLAICGPRPDPNSGILLVQNRVGMAGGMESAEIDRNVGLPTTAYIREDSHVVKSMQLGVPVVELYPRCPASVGIRGLASVLALPAGSARPHRAAPALLPRQSRLLHSVK